MKQRTARVTLTNKDFNVLLEALDLLDDEVRNYEGALDPYRLEIQATNEKIREARDRLR
jgi:hypothetical protein